MVWFALEESDKEENFYDQPDNDRRQAFLIVSFDNCENEALILWQKASDFWCSFRFMKISIVFFYRSVLMEIVYMAFSYFFYKGFTFLKVYVVL